MLSFGSRKSKIFYVFLNRTGVNDMNTRIKYFLALHIALITCFSASGQNVAERPKILVIGLDTLQFSSNVFYLDELAYYNNTGEYDVVELYNRTLMRILKENPGGYEFVVADSADKVNVHGTSFFVETENDYGEEFIGIAPAEGNGSKVIEMMEKYQASYILFINAYQIYRKDPPEYVSFDTRADHIIHFDIFTKELTNVYGGKMSLPSSAVEAFFMTSLYRQFAAEAVKWIKAYERSLENRKSVEENFNLLRDEKYINASGLSLQLAFDGPFGLLGGSFSRFIGRSVEANIGLGFDFSGFKTGIGGNYYVHDAFNNKDVKPFIGLNYFFASGNKFELGGETDDYGNQLDPDDVSEFKIYAEHAIQLQGGVSYWMNNSMASLSAGYGFPFRDKRPQLLSGKDSKGRMNFVEAMAPGGLGITLKYMVFINRRFLWSRFW